MPLRLSAVFASYWRSGGGFAPSPIRHAGKPFPLGFQGSPATWWRPRAYWIDRGEEGPALAVAVASRDEAEKSERWQDALAGFRKDRRSYELVEDTIDQGFQYGYFLLRDAHGVSRAIQPYFINEQDLLAGTGIRIRRLAEAVRRVWPGFLRMRTLMIGSAAGEGQLDADNDGAREAIVESLARSLPQRCRALNAGLVVFKEFTETDRAAFKVLARSGFTRLPSMPMTRLRLDFASYEEYLTTALSRNTRSQMRRKYRDSARQATLEMEVVADGAPYISEIYPLYLAVYERSKLKFEKLTPSYFTEIGRRMPDKTLFFLWRLDGRIVAFNLCTIMGDSLCSDYVGFDYSLAFDLHLYHIVARDVTTWAISKKLKWCRSTSLNYEPKLRLGHELEPLDLYVKHTSPVVNFVLKRVLRFLEPVRYDKQLKRFPNYKELYS
jgi:hypothetical protein